jgi:hypothetical protein
MVRGRSLRNGEESSAYTGFTQHRLSAELGIHRAQPPGRVRLRAGTFAGRRAGLLWPIRTTTCAWASIPVIARFLAILDRSACRRSRRRRSQRQLSGVVRLDFGVERTLTLRARGNTPIPRGSIRWPCRMSAARMRPRAAAAGRVVRWSEVLNDAGYVQRDQQTAIRSCSSAGPSQVASA